MPVSRTVAEIFSFEEWDDPEMLVMGRSRPLKWRRSILYHFRVNWRWI